MTCSSPSRVLSAVSSRISTPCERCRSRNHAAVSGAAISFWYYCGDRLLAVDAMNDPRAYMTGKRLIEAGRSPDPALVADPETALKALLAA